jgi:hypothetical protein
MADDLKSQRKKAIQTLHDAAQIGDVSTVRSIFETHKEFSINITRKGKNTILHTALFHNQDGMLLDYLIDMGADVNLENCKGYTPIVVAITHCKEVVAIEKLVAAGAEYNVELDSGSFAGMTLLQVAEKHKNEQAVTFLKYLKSNEGADRKVLLEKDVPKNRAFCPICNTLVRFPTQMSRLRDNQAQVEENYKLFGQYGKKKKKSKVYTSRQYLDQFLNHADGETWKKLCGVEFHAMENMALRKEISESYAVLHAVQECCDKLFGLCRSTNGNLNLSNIFLIDLCSGKGITSALGAALFPNDNFFLSIDKMLAHTVPHYFFNDEEHISYMSRDIFSNKILHELETLVRQHTINGRTAILVGMHCCGILSERAIELYEHIPDIKGIVLSPCCLPKKHELKKHQLRFKPPIEKGQDPYPSWSSYLKVRVEGCNKPSGPEDVLIYQDLEMHTEKNYMVVGISK